MIKAQVKSWWQLDWVQVLLSFFAISIVRFFPVFFAQKTLYFGDNYSLLVPGKLFTVHWLQQGIVPLWNPTLFSGLSWIGDISQSVFYPSTLAFLALPAGSALSVTVLAHLLLTMTGMYLLAKWFSGDHRSALLVSGLWMVSSQMTGSANNLATLQSLPWLPWVLYAAVKLPTHPKGFLLLTGVLLLNLLAGYPQHILLVLPVALVFSFMTYWRPEVGQKWSWKRWFGQWFLAGICTLGLSAFVLWPFVEVLLISTRLNQSSTQAAIGSLHPAESIKIFLPYFFDAPVFGLRWGPSWNTFPTALPYVTWLGLGAVLLSARQLLSQKVSRILLLLTIGSLIISLGKFLPGFLWLVTSVPGLSAIRYPSSWLVIANVCLLLMLAIALPKIKLSATFTKGLAALLGLLALGSGAGLLGAWLRPDLVWQLLNQVTGQALANSVFHTQARDQVILLVILGNVLLNAVLTLAAVLSLKAKKMWLVVGFLLLDGVVNTQALLLFAPNTIYELPQNQELVSLLQDPSQRTLTRNFNEPYTDYGSYWEALVVRAPFSDSFVDEQEFRSAEGLQRLRDGLTPDWNMPVNVPLVNGYTTLVPITYQYQWGDDAEARINALSHISLDHPQLQNWAVKYYLVDNWFTIKEPLPESEPIFEQEHWQVYELPTLSRFRFASDQPVTFSSFSENPNQLSFSFTNDQNEPYLKVADRYETGWIAHVNDQPVRVENWDELRAIPIAHGENTVVMKYQPRSFIYGSLISLGTGILVLVWLIVQQLRQRFPALRKRLKK